MQFQSDAVLQKVDRIVLVKCGDRYLLAILLFLIVTLLLFISAAVPGLGLSVLKGAPRDLSTRTWVFLGALIVLFQSALISANANIARKRYLSVAGLFPRAALSTIILTVAGMVLFVPALRININMGAVDASLIAAFLGTSTLLGLPIIVRFPETIIEIRYPDYDAARDRMRECELLIQSISTEASVSSLQQLPTALQSVSAGLKEQLVWEVPWAAELSWTIARAAEALAQEANICVRQYRNVDTAAIAFQYALLGEKSATHPGVLQSFRTYADLTSQLSLVER